MRGQKRVEYARERAGDPRIHRKKTLRQWMDCRVKPGSDGRSASIAAIWLAQAVLHRPALLAAVPRFIAARAIVHRFSRIALRSTVIRAWRRPPVRRGCIVGGRGIVRRGGVVG